MNKKFTQLEKRKTQHLHQTTEVRQLPLLSVYPNRIARKQFRNLDVCA